MAIPYKQKSRQKFRQSMRRVSGRGSGVALRTVPRGRSGVAWGVASAAWLAPGNLGVRGAACKDGCLQWASGRAGGLGGSMQGVSKRT